MADDFILSAKNPLLFVAFCFEYKKMIETFKEHDTFTTHLPIQLDASCNGLQHLSCIISDSKLAMKVNIVESDTSLDPYDLYMDCVDLIRQNIKNGVSKYPVYASLLKLRVDRKLIKRSIMTIPYNVTPIGIREQLEEHFDKKWSNLRYYEFTPKDKDSYGDVTLTSADMIFLAKIIHQTLYNEHPKLKELVKY